MTILVILLSICSLLTILRLVQYRQQLKTINQQLRFILRHDSNLLLTTQIRDKQLNEMIVLLNQDLVKQKNKNSEFQRQEQLVKEAITNLAHDIRTPLTSLDGYFQLLIKSTDNNKRAIYESIIKNRITTLTEMLEGIFMYTKLQNNDYDIQLSQIQINQLLYTNLFACFPLFSEKGIEPELRITEEPLVIWGEAASLSRMFSNLLKNSIDHGSGPISINLYKDAQQVVFLCQNTINLAEPMDTSQLFERFYMAEASRNGRSTGLGLFITRELVKKMNGTIDLNASQNLFSVKVSFPSC
ncbi:HAMP domain-containing sensor histidine kinase [uncultured Vagococcus sp.]|uniref:sensor histidine kinase n=1 Tax=uncultured Vagococcus sp. TaxID=189676 RepID=UPI0028D1F565|nr:HAMP domain-containing sensor histidine kinase [uncultured Vagococcus sp.]